MATARQIAANRENAKKSTGPKTAEGKQNVRLNALRHGLTGQVNLMPAEDRAAHDKFCAGIVADLAPEGALETQLAQSVAEDNWRMNRARAIETNIFALGAFYPAGRPVDAGDTGSESGNAQIAAALHAAQVFASDPKQFQLLSLYLQRTNRDMQKTLDRLTGLQSERKAHEKEIERLSSARSRNAVADNRPAGQDLSRKAPGKEREPLVKNGFVFSTDPYPQPDPHYPTSLIVDTTSFTCLNIHEGA